MNIDLSGKTALVTGGGAGIGADICTRLSALGAEVFVLDRDPEAARTVASSLNNATPIEVDLRNPAEITAALERNPRLHQADILVNNAGLTRVERFTESDPSTWDAFWQVNLRAPMHLCHALTPSMAEKGWGRIVFVSTDSARAGGGGEGVYSAT